MSHPQSCSSSVDCNSATRPSDDCSLPRAVSLITYPVSTWRQSFHMQIFYHNMFFIISTVYILLTTVVQHDFMHFVTCSCKETVHSTDSTVRTDAWTTSSRRRSFCRTVISLGGTLFQLIMRTLMILSTDMAYCAHNLITFCVTLVSASLLCCSLTASVLSRSIIAYKGLHRADTPCALLPRTSN